MKIGEIVEILIHEKDGMEFGDRRKQAMEEACRILEKLPGAAESGTYADDGRGWGQ